MKNNLNQKSTVEILIKNGPSFHYQIPDSYLRFNEDFFKKGYPLSNGELSYINGDNKKIIIKSKNDFITLLRFVRNKTYTVQLFYEKELYESFINDFQFIDIKNVYSDLDINDSNIDLEQINQYDQNYNTLNTINEIVDNIDKGSLFMGNKIITYIFKKKCLQKLIQYTNSEYCLNNKKRKIYKMPEPIKLEYNIPSIDNLLNNNNLVEFPNINNNDILNILTSHLERIEDCRNNNLIFQTMINRNNELSNVKNIESNITFNNNKNKLISNTEIIQSTLCQHFGFKCENCHIKPINNKRFKCPKCINYNLCEKCEEINAYNPFHPHQDFIMIRISKNNFSDNPYSYQCLTKNLVFNIKKDENKNNEIIISNILIKNNFILPWPGAKKTMFKCDKALSTIFCEKIFLPNLSLGNTVNVDFIFKKINKIPKGNYNCIIDFIVNGEKYGEPLEIFINLK